MEFKNYLITGANSYLGQALVERLTAAGDSRLLLITRKDFDFSIFNDKNIVFLKGIDLLKEDDLKIVAEKTKTYFSGKFNVLNCTGYYDGQQTFESTSLAESKKILDANYTTVLGVASSLIPIMCTNGGGHFIGFSCNSVRYNYPQMAPFTAAKSALESLIRSIANEFYDRGIYANAFQLATLLTEHEKTVKPFADQKNWLNTADVACYVQNFITQPNQLVNGNSINLYHHSDSFFHSSYFERIKR